MLELDAAWACGHVVRDHPRRNGELLRRGQLRTDPGSNRKRFRKGTRAAFNRHQLPDQRSSTGSRSRRQGRATSAEPSFGFPRGSFGSTRSTRFRRSPASGARITRGSIVGCAVLREWSGHFLRPRTGYACCRSNNRKTRRSDGLKTGRNPFSLGLGSVKRCRTSSSRPTRSRRQTRPLEA
jgi:hypothetical protein